MTDIRAPWAQSGFMEEPDNVEASLGYLKGHMAVFPAYVTGIPEQRLLERPGPGKWSRKEILGHLIDSAVHNLVRFTEIPSGPFPFVIVSYRQADLVRLNHYQDLPLPHLITLWEGLNRQIIAVIERLTASELSLPVLPGYEDSATRTLGWVFCDYVAHLEHHLRQVYAFRIHI
jgi:hypothetical protein